METNKKREAVIYICFLIVVIITLLILPLYSIKLFETTQDMYTKFKLIIDSLLQFFALSLIILVCSMIIVSIFI
jgi:hypothetical protein